MPGGPRHVLALVGLGRDPPHGVELRTEQRPHRGGTLPVGLAVRPSVAAARFRVDLRAVLG